MGVVQYRVREFGTTRTKLLTKTQIRVVDTYLQQCRERNIRPDDDWIISLCEQAGCPIDFGHIKGH